MIRIKSVDVFRVAAIMAVIAIHARPFRLQTDQIGSFDFPSVINQLSRFAVPFFFVMSGYFWAQKTDAVQFLYRSLVSTASRMTVIFVFWSGIYLIEAVVLRSNGGLIDIARNAYWDLMKYAGQPVNTLLEGTRAHLWFLPGLLSRMLLSVILVSIKKERLQWPLGFFFYLLFLVAGAYQNSPVGLVVNFNVRNGPFFGFIFFVIGWHLYFSKLSRFHWFKIGAIVAVAGTALQFYELYIIHQLWGSSVLQDGIMATLLTGLGVSLMALSDHPRLHFNRTAQIGQTVLGIYAIHFIFIDLLDTRHQWTDVYAINEILYIVTVFVLSAGVANFLARSKYTKIVVA